MKAKGKVVATTKRTAGPVRSLPFCILLLLQATLAMSPVALGQDDFYPIPQRQGNFGFPYPPPAADEPGVTFARRYMLDGEPEFRFSPRRQDEIWLVSTRNFQDNQLLFEGAHQNLTCKHPVDSSWNQVPIEQLLDVQKKHSDVPTIVFVHGNRTNAFWSRRRGKQAYQALVGERSDLSYSPVAKLPPSRFVIWSWPSDPEGGPFQDFALKSERTRMEGELFGQFLNQLSSGPIVIVAYSLGTQIALDGIVKLAHQSQVNSKRVQLISMAPVTRCEWPDHLGQMQLAAAGIDQMALFQNPDDLALKAFDAYCLIHGHNSCQSSIAQLANIHGSAQQFDVSQQVGREHNIISYASVPMVRAKLAELITSSAK